MMASGAIWDDESAAKVFPATQMPELPQQQPQKEHHHYTGILGWLFGDDDDEQDNSGR